MTLNIEIPDGLANALAAKAEASGVTASRYARLVLEKALTDEDVKKPKKSAYGLLSHYGPGPSLEDIDENRKEMLQGFAEDQP